MTSHFNLISEPWIVVRKPDNSVREVSIRDAFHHAQDYSGLGGEIPTQMAAIQRCLQAIAMRATAARRSEDEAILQWGQWWEEQSLPLEQIDAYLDRYADRFDLLDPEKPFMQVADLHTSTNKTSGLVKLISEVPSGAKFFTTRDGKGIQSLSLAEAARWLVHVHAFDVSGIKSGAVGDPRVGNGKGYPIGTGITGNMGLVIVEGSSLLQTLLLNLVVPTDPREDTSIWEREPQNAKEDVRHPVPTGPADLFTWQSRRVRLIEHDGHIVDVLLCNGDKTQWSSLLRKETQTAWRYSTPQSKKAGKDIYMPRTHQPGRAIWRGLEPLLMKATDESSIRPDVLEWLAKARQSELLSPTQMIRIRTIGIEYGSNSSIIAATVDDSLPTSIALLGEDALARLAIEAAQTAQDAAICLANLASDLASAAGTEPDADRAHAWDAAFSAIDPVFRDWFAHLSADTQTHEAKTAWHRAVRDTINREGLQLCRDAGASALTGRVVPIPNTDRTTLMDTAEAWRRFTRHLMKTTPIADGDQKPGSVPASSDIVTTK
ncbi:CRISPR system Cascade subunit CasA [Propionibacterium cyclohexanicum]|uniref:CRISPR system Cascade subunit CasA n=1 Tax=Propionibacterium cyclohexanicum TaxID=64702 RepID=A0A1H9U584_9ACTN|nr:type I-E CRISPR-associated protein Cse1/CasA [Propionibacterium cyclohexanicum]SES04398.1 CRISPR system Cascade subunit CasA [Propionibacterium cyclohexanicum]